jgi:hypothetical protein
MIDASAAAGCGARPAATGWAMWRMPNPAAAQLPNPSSYTDLGDGTVRDDVTCLVWQRDVPEDGYSWDEAASYRGDMSLAGGMASSLQDRAGLTG